jgi:hypothetical protein
VMARYDPSNRPRDDLALFERHPAFIHTKVIGNFTVVVHFENRDISQLAGLERPNLLLAV